MLRNIALWIHILGAGTWIGANVAQAVVGPRMMEDNTSGRVWLRTLEKISGPLYGGAGAAILLTGIYLVLRSGSGYSFGSVFVGIGIAVLIVTGFMGSAVFGKKTKQILGMYDSGDTSNVAKVYRTIGPWGIFDTALVALAIFAMVAKWGA